MIAATLFFSIGVRGIFTSSFFVVTSSVLFSSILNGFLPASPRNLHPNTNQAASRNIIRAQIRNAKEYPLTPATTPRIVVPKNEPKLTNEYIVENALSSWLGSLKSLPVIALA